MRSIPARYITFDWKKFYAAVVFHLLELTPCDTVNSSSEIALSWRFRTKFPHGFFVYEPDWRIMSNEQRLVWLLDNLGIEDVGIGDFEAQFIFKQEKTPPNSTA